MLIMVELIRPKDPLSQPYSYKSTVFIVNQGIVDLKNWNMLIELQKQGASGFSYCLSLQQ